MTSVYDNQLVNQILLFTANFLRTNSPSGIKRFGKNHHRHEEDFSKYFCAYRP